MEQIVGPRAIYLIVSTLFSLHRGITCGNSRFHKQYHVGRWRGYFLPIFMHIFSLKVVVI